jgi:hypothetical protein
MILSPFPKLMFLANNGRPLVGGQLFTYEAGTNTKQATYSDAGGTPNTNPVVLDFRGEANVWLDPELTYKFVLAPSGDTDPPTNPIWSVDDISIIELTQDMVGRALWPRTPEEIAAGVTPVYYYYPPLDVKRYGALGNFDPSDGSGADDRLPFVYAVRVAMECTGGAEIAVPFGNYYMGTGFEPFDAVTNPASAQVPIGIGGTPGSITNVTIRGEGATIFVGKAGQSWAVYCAQNVRITGLWFYGYTGGTLGASRENDAPLILANESYNVRVDHCYITNSLGDCITIYGDRANLNSDYQCRNVTIDHNVLKERYGNGVQSLAGGTKSRLCLAVIDCIGLDVHDNTIYGQIDLEPNFNYEHIVDTDIHNNHFLSGHVTAQAVIGTEYWFDEPVNSVGGDIIQQVVSLVSIAVPDVSNNSVRDNNFESGKITWDGAETRFDLVIGNVFEEGWILGHAAATGARTKIIDNMALGPLSPNDIFVEFTAGVSLTEVWGNSALAAGWAACVGLTGSGADSGNNVWGINVCEGGTPYNFTPAANSTVADLPFVGTWTPVLTFATPGDLSVTYAGGGQVGTYKRIGREVTVDCRIVTSAFTHTTASGALRVTGLPFTSANSGVSYQGSLRWEGINKATYTQVTSYVDPAVSLVAFEAAGMGVARAAIATGDVPSGGTPALIFTLTYTSA